MIVIRSNKVQIQIPNVFLYYAPVSWRTDTAKFREFLEWVVLIFKWRPLYWFLFWFCGQTTHITQNLVGLIIFFKQTVSFPDQNWQGFLCKKLSSPRSLTYFPKTSPTQFKVSLFSVLVIIGITTHKMPPKCCEKCPQGNNRETTSLIKDFPRKRFCWNSVGIYH